MRHPIREQTGRLCRSQLRPADTNGRYVKLGSVSTAWFGPRQERRAVSTAVELQHTLAGFP